MHASVKSEVNELVKLEKRASRVGSLGVLAIAVSLVGALWYAHRLGRSISNKQAELAALEEQRTQLKSDVAVLATKHRHLFQQNSELHVRATGLEAALEVELEDRLDPENKAPVEAPAPDIAPSKSAHDERMPSKSATTSFSGKAPIIVQLTDSKAPDIASRSEQGLRAKTRQLDGQFSYSPGTKTQLYAIDMWLDPKVIQDKGVTRVTYSLTTRYYKVNPVLTSTNAEERFKVTVDKIWGCVANAVVDLETNSGHEKLVFDWCRAANWDEREGKPVGDAKPTDDAKPKASPPKKSPGYDRLDDISF